MQRIRWPRNLSVWSGSDSDSDGQTVQRRTRPANMHINLPAGSSNQTTSGTLQPIQGVYLFCAGDEVDLSTLQTPLVPKPIPNVPTMGAATVSPSDAIFSPSSIPLPISLLIGIPLLMRRLQSKPSPTSPHFQNTLASQLSLDPTTATAITPDSGARGLGTVLVVRLDREPLQKDLLDRICAFHAKLLSLAQQKGSGSMAEVLRAWATPEQFLTFCAESNRPNGGANNVLEMLGGSWLDLQRPMAAV